VAEASNGPADLGDIRVELLYEDAAASATAGIWRYSVGPWSVVLKLLRHSTDGSPAWQSGEPVDHWYYWRREANAYESGVLQRLAPSLRAPHCYGVFDRPDGSCAIWLEDLGAMPAGTSWDLHRYGLAARDLGRAQGRLARAGDLPDESWLAREWLRHYVERREAAVAQIEDPSQWGHPLVRELLGSETRHECRAIWDEREDLLAVLESMPLTLVHSDLHPRNLFGSDAETVLIDWGFVGRGHIGEDPGNVVFDAVLDFFVDPHQVHQLQTVLVDGYLAGLSEAGWSGDPEAVPRAMAAAGAVKYFWIPPAMASAAASGSPTLNRRPLEEAFRHWAPLVPEIFAARRAALR
jgi:hypothetical protein